MTARGPYRWPDSAALWILVVLAALLFLRAARALLIPIALAVLFSYALEPAVAWLERHHVRRLVGAALILASILAVVAGGAYTLRDDVRQLVQSIPTALERTRQVVRSQLGHRTDASESGTGEKARAGKPDSGGDQMEQALGTSGQTAGSWLQQAVSMVLTLAGNAVVVFFLIYFLLISGRHVRNRLIEIAGPDPERRRTTAKVIDDINTQIQRYLLVLLATGAIVAAATWAVLAWMGVQHAAMWGILAGIFNSIPYFGPVIVSGGLFVVGLAQGGGLTQALQMAGAAILITSLEGWLLAPPLMGKAERMSALTVFLGLLLWTWLWGEWGTVLAVPMLVIIKSVADHVDSIRPVGRLMAP